MNVRSGGYLLIERTERADYMDEQRIPEFVQSASACICEQHPTLDVLWGTSKRRKEAYRERLRLSEEDFLLLMEWVEVFHESGELGYPQTFQTIELAKTFRDRFFTHIELDIIELKLPVSYVADFLAEGQVGDHPEQYGVERFILRHEHDEPLGRPLGYEVLGYEYGTFHSYLCNGLEHDFAERFTFRLNDHGFIATLEEAERYCAYSNQEDVGTEPVLWLPWIISKVE
ncbi:hypothetical protein [Exiguobacterium alkaliphilum]|uniref:Uncharacterized protein n=1 Tax=Exiguobacterium alkaliphilum TaxID=1428684 RepID=A0ABT2KZR9_9BACL|nr:hypothetical protein [Exiguobacterium alkaliphilum]MCT4796407.1 hypothetical protein [Exiguobacterium alkaliphilum]